MRYFGWNGTTPAQSSTLFTTPLWWPVNKIKPMNRYGHHNACSFILIRKTYSGTGTPIADTTNALGIPNTVRLYGRFVMSRFVWPDPAVLVVQKPFVHRSARDVEVRYNKVHLCKHQTHARFTFENWFRDVCNGNQTLPTITLKFDTLLRKQSFYCQNPINYVQDSSISYACIVVIKINYI